MNSNTKRSIRNKARLICGLANILQYDAENLKSDTDIFDADRIMQTIGDAKYTVQNLMDTLTEIEYQLYLQQFKES